MISDDLFLNDSELINVREVNKAATPPGQSHTPRAQIKQVKSNVLMVTTELTRINLSYNIMIKLLSEYEGLAGI